MKKVKGLNGLVILAILSTIMMPIALADVTPAIVAPDPNTAGEAAKYTIDFSVEINLTTDDTITVVFPEATGVPESMTADNVTVNDVACTVDPTIEDLTVTVTTPVNVPDNVSLVFLIGAGITNPTAGDYTLNVSTSEEPNLVESEVYTIE
jgi:hypothetical protein